MQSDMCFHVVQEWINCRPGILPVWFCLVSLLQVETHQESFTMTVCFAFSILGRRLFYQHAQQGAGRRKYVEI